jgi:hypothetical protein
MNVLHLETVITASFNNNRKELAMYDFDFDELQDILELIEQNGYIEAVQVA